MQLHKSNEHGFISEFTFHAPVIILLFFGLTIFRASAVFVKKFFILSHKEEEGLRQRLDAAYSSFLYLDIFKYIIINFLHMRNSDYRDKVIKITNKIYL